MYALARPFLFALPPEVAHAFAMASLGLVEHVAPIRFLTRAIYTHHDIRNRTRAMGLDFPSPIGLAGGVDKNATRFRTFAALGLGFLELGTVTAQAQSPNPSPNMFRLPVDRALVNRLGFPNQGAAHVARRFASAGGARSLGVPVGFSIGKSRVVAIEEDVSPVIADYQESFRAVAPVSDFVVINISSPNTQNLRALQSAAFSRSLLTALRDQNPEKKPILVKIAPDLSDEDLTALLDVVGEVGLAGVIATNTTIERKNLMSPSSDIEAIGAGGLSGPPLFNRARDVVAIARKVLGKDATIIGVGGISNGDDACAMMDAGANLLQVYTAFIYRGPGAASAIERERLLAVNAKKAAR